MAAMPDIEPPRPPVRAASLRALIAAAGSELMALAKEGHRLQELIGAHVAAHSSREEAVEDAQLLDVLLQHHEALAEVLHRLAEQTPPATVVKLDAVLGPVPLAGLADRLAGAERELTKASGELEVL